MLRAHEIEHFFYIGGNDSSDTVRIVSEEARKAGYPLRCIHIPKTIDNDLVGNDHTPGFPSAARFVAQAFAGANLDNAALPGVYVGVVMGRHAGFLTAAVGTGQEVPGRRPAPDLHARAHLRHRALPGRREGHLRALRALRDRGVRRHPRCVGRGDRSRLLAKEIERDAHGNVQLSGTGALADLLCEEIKTKLGIKRVRGDTFGYLQRSFIGCVSDVDQREAREVGEKAVQFAMWGDRDGSVAIKRTGYYSVDYELMPLEDVAGKTRVMEDEFITAERHRRDRCVPAVPAPAAGIGDAGRVPAASGAGGEDPEQMKPKIVLHVAARSLRITLAQCGSTLRPAQGLPLARFRPCERACSVADSHATTASIAATKRCTWHRAIGLERSMISEVAVAFSVTPSSSVKHVMNGRVGDASRSTSREHAGNNADPARSRRHSA